MVDTRAALWERYKEQGDMEARTALIEEYLYLAKFAVERFRISPYGALGYDDLIGYATIGLIEAVDKYDLSKNVRFASYAMLRIRGAIIDAIRRSDWAPRRIRKNESALATATERLQTRLERAPTNEEIAAYMNVTVDKVECMTAEVAQAAMYSLDQVVSETGNVDVAHAEEESRLDRMQLCKWIQRAIAVLPEREMRVVRMYYYDRMMLKDIARVLKVSPCRVRQIHANAIRLMRNR